MAIRIRLSRILGDKRIRVAHLSPQTGLSKYALHKLYHEKNKGIELAILDKLCRALRCSVGDLLEYLPGE